jgi:hypothetical protein
LSSIIVVFVVLNEKEKSAAAVQVRLGVNDRENPFRVREVFKQTQIAVGKRISLTQVV